MRYLDRICSKIGIMADDLENYRSLMNLVDCVYQMATIGQLGEKDGQAYLEIDKILFKKAFKGPIAFSFRILEKHGFDFRYMKAGTPALSFKNADSFYCFFDGEIDLIPAMSHMVKALPAVNAKEDYVGKQSLLFAMADFDSILYKAGTRQTAISPLRPGIIDTLGDKADLWHHMAEGFSALGLAHRAYINPYVFPNWTVKFIYQGKTIITFTITPDNINVSLPLSYPMAKQVITNRKSLPDLFDKSINGFGCIGCGKCRAQAGLACFEGVLLCTREASNTLGDSPRAIHGSLTQIKEATAILNIIKAML